MTTIRVHICIESLDLAVLVDCDLPPGEEGVALTRGDDVFVTVEHTAHWTLGFLCCDSNNACELNGTCFFAPETTLSGLANNK